ncbi:hypothetical protein PCANB_002244 [Pneumocystis canis]|nr:hypothetical protein PCANB_002244 [Pneumocystis canis]
MGRLEMNDFNYNKISTNRCSLSMYLVGNNGSSNDGIENSLPNSRRLLGLKKDLKDVLEKIQTERSALEQELKNIQEKYKDWLFVNSDVNILPIKDENFVKEDEKIIINTDLSSSQKSHPLNESIQKKSDVSDEKTVFESTSHESFKDIVESSELPKPLFSEKEYVYNEILDISDPQELKRHLGVSYFPTVDLSDKLPGAAVNDDFSKVKAPIQVSISTYYASLDPFYRPFSEEDLVFLKEKDDEFTTYMIPPLGIFSENVWASDDLSGTISSNLHSPSSLPYGSPSQLTDEHLFTEDISCGPLLERLLSAILKEENNSDDEEKKNDNDNEKDADLNNCGWKIPSTKIDYPTFEERLKKELRHIGILGDNNIDWNNREDDEISSNLRSLQCQLRRQCAINSARKNKLSELIKEHLAYQEYSIILNDLNKQVEQAFLKRSKIIEARKKRGLGTNSADLGSGRIGLSNYIQTLLERRKKWIEKVGSIFTPIEKYTRLPTSTIYDDLNNIKTDESINENEL